MNDHTTAAAFSVDEAKARFSELLARAAAGEEVHITRHGKPYVKLDAENPGKPKLPRWGAFNCQFSLPDNWDDIPTGFEP